MTFKQESLAELAYKQSGLAEGKRVWILHGIMGSRQNWSRFARHLGLAQPHLSITTIDLRCHGDNVHIEGPHTIAACVHDLLVLGELIGRPQVVIGHSFGGKVALQYAADASKVSERYSLETVWTLDSPLEAAVKPGQGEVARVIEVCGLITMPQPTRQAVIEYFTERGFALGIAQWMTTNLKRVNVHQPSQSGFEWKFDLQGIKSLIADYWRVDGWSLLEEVTPEIQLHLLRAERGLRWTEADAQRMAKFHPHIEIPLLKDSGHWVHIEQLESLITLLGAL